MFEIGDRVKLKNPTMYTKDEGVFVGEYAEKLAVVVFDKDRRNSEVDNGVWEVLQRRFYLADRDRNYVWRVGYDLLEKAETYFKLSVSNFQVGDTVKNNILEENNVAKVVLIDKEYVVVEFDKELPEYDWWDLVGWRDWQKNHPELKKYSRKKCDLWCLENVELAETYFKLAWAKWPDEPDEESLSEINAVGVPVYAKGKATGSLNPNERVHFRIYENGRALLTIETGSWVRCSESRERTPEQTIERIKLEYPDFELVENTYFKLSYQDSLVWKGTIEHLKTKQHIEVELWQSPGYYKLFLNGSPNSQFVASNIEEAIEKAKGEITGDFYNLIWEEFVKVAGITFEVGDRVKVNTKEHKGYEGEITQRTRFGDIFVIRLTKPSWNTVTNFFLDDYKIDKSKFDYTYDVVLNKCWLTKEDIYFKLSNFPDPTEKDLALYGAKLPVYAVLESQNIKILIYDNGIGLIANKRDATWIPSSSIRRGATKELAVEQAKEIYHESKVTILEPEYFKISSSNKLYSILTTPAHKDLDPELFDLKTKKMLPEVREKILTPLFDELKERGFTPDKLINGVYLIGSSAGKHWNHDSDLDVTITVNV